MQSKHTKANELEDYLENSWILENSFVSKGLGTVTHKGQTDIFCCRKATRETPSDPCSFLVASYVWLNRVRACFLRSD